MRQHLPGREARETSLRSMPTAQERLLDPKAGCARLQPRGNTGRGGRVNGIGGTPTVGRKRCPVIVSEANSVRRAANFLTWPPRKQVVEFDHLSSLTRSNRVLRQQVRAEQAATGLETRRVMAGLDPATHVFVATV